MATQSPKCGSKADVYLDGKREFELVCELTAGHEKERPHTDGKMGWWTDDALTPACENCGRYIGCTPDCEDMNCEHCYCGREGRDG